MATRGHQTIVPLEAWLAQSLRATIFPAPSITPNPDTWWRATLGTDAESRTVKPATREHTEEGALEGAKLLLHVNALGIIQWQVAPSDPKELPSDLPTVGQFVAVLPAFTGLLERWFQMCPVSARLAFGAHALLPVQGHREGYETLNTLLRDHVRLDPNTSSDFLYRINRPRASTSAVAGLRINRLATWNLLKTTLFAIASAGPSGVVAERYACRVELDINTVPTFEGTFEPSAAVEVFRELREMALEILAEGDVP